MDILLEVNCLPLVAQSILVVYPSQSRGYTGKMGRMATRGVPPRYVHERVQSQG